MTIVQTEDKLAELARASARVDEAEQELEQARADLGQLMRRLHDAGEVSIQQMEKTTGYSRGHVYVMMGPASQPRSAVRRERRRDRRREVS